VSVFRFSRRCTALILLSLGLPSIAAAQTAGETVITQGTVKQDIYLAGGTVDMLATVEGDVVAAGGQVSIDNTVSGDVMAIGGNVSVRARVGDDVRVAGGNVTLSGTVGDDALAAGGNVLLAPNAAVGGRAWLAGGTVEIAGKVGRGVKAAGNRVIVAGDITGDVQLAADTIEIRPNAVIRGNLTYYSRNEAQIASGAKITGAVQHEPVAPSQKRAQGYVFGHLARLGLYISLMLTGIVLYLLFPRAAVGAARTIAETPMKSLGLGLAVLAATPLVALLLFASLLGIWLALTTAAIYLVFLLLGFLTGILAVGDWGLRLIGRAGAATPGWRALSIIAALLLLWVVRFVPGLGGVIVFALLVFGLGALTLHLWRRYVGA
jgi:cytoskeletal protein CcmA (bactofilin family)